MLNKACRLLHGVRAPSSHRNLHNSTYSRAIRKTGACAFGRCENQVVALSFFGKSANMTSLHNGCFLLVLFLSTLVAQMVHLLAAESLVDLTPRRSF